MWNNVDDAGVWGAGSRGWLGGLKYGWLSVDASDTANAIKHRDPI